MKFSFQTFLIIFIFYISINDSLAQQIVLTAGGEGTGSGGTVSNSIGQVVYTLQNDQSFTITQGVQQPYEISVTTGIEDAKNINLSAHIYPNPTHDYLTLSIEDIVHPDISFYLYDNQGSLIQHEKITANHTNIVVRNLVVATYFLTVVHNDKELRTFKIIKN